MMGPNAMRITEELAAHLPVSPDMRILDIGCGMGISSILLAQKYHATVFAADLWISPTENAERFHHLGLGKRIIPLRVDARGELPFAHHYFDMIISVDSYHYFGANETALERILPCLKRGGHLGIAVPGLKQDFSDGIIPQELQPFWQADMEFHSCAWWKDLWRKEKDIILTSCREMACFRRAWDDWLQSPNPHAKNDRAMMTAEGGKYFNLVQITGQKR